MSKMTLPTLMPCLRANTRSCKEIKISPIYTYLTSRNRIFLVTPLSLSRIKLSLEVEIPLKSNTWPFKLTISILHKIMETSKIKVLKHLIECKIDLKSWSRFRASLEYLNIKNTREILMHQFYILQRVNWITYKAPSRWETRSLCYWKIKASPNSISNSPNSGSRSRIRES